MGWLISLLAIATATLAWLLARLVVQNRDLPAQLRASGRRPGELLGTALRWWTPIGLAIVVVVLAAHGLGAATVALAYRLTPLEAYCSVGVGGSAPTAPCTGLDLDVPVTPSSASSAQRLDRFISERYARARQTLARLPPAAIDDPARRRALLRALAPAVVLGLPESPEDDPELRRMVQELRQLLAAPPAPARHLLDQVRFRADQALHVRRLRELTAQVRVRREQLAQAAYSGREPLDQGRLWLRHRLAHRLAPAARQPAPPTREALFARLVRDEAWTAQVLAPETVNAKSRAALGLALPLADACVLASSLDHEFPCTRELRGAARPLKALGLRESVRLSIEHWHRQSRRSAARELGRIALAAERGQLALADADAAVARAVPARIGLGRRECGLAQPSHCASNLALAGVEQALAQGAQEAASAVTDPVAAAGLRGRRALEARIGAVAGSLDARLAALREGAHRQAARAFLARDLLRALGWLTLALVAVRSLLYLLALQVYRLDGGTVLGFADAPSVQGSYRVGRRLVLARDFTEALVTRRQLSNSDNRLRFAPWPGSAPIARLLRGRYLLYTRGRFLADASGNTSPAHPSLPDSARGELPGRVASAEGGQAIVEWRLQPGEEVVFRYQDFFGASENLRLRTRLSLRLSTLLLGRILFRYAQCPPGGGEGMLLLKADIEAIDPAQLRALPPERLIAWNRQARFRVHGPEGAWATLVHGYTLVRDEHAGGLVLASSADSAPAFGALRFVRRLFLAFF